MITECPLLMIAAAKMKQKFQTEEIFDYVIISTGRNDTECVPYKINGKEYLLQ